MYVACMSCKGLCAAASGTVFTHMRKSFKRLIARWIVTAILHSASRERCKTERALVCAAADSVAVKRGSDKVAAAAEGDPPRKPVVKPRRDRKVTHLAVCPRQHINQAFPGSADLHARLIVCGQLLSLSVCSKREAPCQVVGLSLY